VPEDNGVETAEAGATFWSGTITFGLVSVPVALMAAVRSQRVSLRMVSPEGRPLSRRYFTARDDEPLRWEEIVRGYEVEPDRYVTVEDDELDRLAPERSRDIDLRVFVPVEQLDPMYFDRAYYLVPAGSSTKAYRLLARVMEDASRAGIATFVMRGKEYLIAILAENGILRAETLRFADEVRTPADVGLPEPSKPPAGEVRRIAKEIAERSEPHLDLEDLKDRGAERLLSLARSKLRSGEDVVEVEEEEAESAGVIDLMEMLQRSLRGEKPGRRPRSPGNAEGEDLSRASKAQLYERAKELDIPGRSGMNRDDLAEAIRGHT
jgi:DNA end-binding protein Ku